MVKSPLRTIYLLAPVLTGLLLLAACGNRGALYLPDESEPVEPVVAVEAEEDEEEKKREQQ